MAREGAGEDCSVRKITSLQNDRVKAIRALDMRKVRRETGLFVAEGASVILTARDAGHVPQSLVYCPGRAQGSVYDDLVRWACLKGCEVLEVSQAVLGKLSSKDNPQAMLGVFAQRFGELPDAAACKTDDVWLALEEIRDPGNLGAILRTCDAAGVAGVILVGTCCDPYSREGVRATMGSVFNVAIARSEHGDFQRLAKAWGGDVVGLHLSGAEDFREARYQMPVLVVMGREGPGLSDETSRLCSRLVKIPMSGQLDSLNLSVATALTIYQIRGPYLSI